MVTFENGKTVRFDLEFLNNGQYLVQNKKALFAQHCVVYSYLLLLHMYSYSDLMSLVCHGGVIVTYVTVIQRLWKSC